MTATAEPAKPTIETKGATKRISPRTLAVPPETRDTVKSLYIAGLNIARISAETGVKPNTIKTWAVRNGWVAVRLNAQQIIVRRGEREPVSAAASAISGESSRVRKLLGDVVTQHAEVLAADKVTDASDLANTPARQGKAAVLKTLVDSASVIYDWDSSRTSSLVLVGVGGQEPDEPGAVDVVSSVEPAEESAAEPEANAS